MDVPITTASIVRLAEHTLGSLTGLTIPNREVWVWPTGVDMSVYSLPPVTLNELPVSDDEQLIPADALSFIFVRSPRAAPFAQTVRNIADQCLHL